MAPTQSKNKKMKKILIVALVVCSALVCGALVINSQSEKDQSLVAIIMQGLASYHFEPETIDNDFSKKVFSEHVDHLDHFKRFLLQSDVNELKKYETSIDNQINTTRFEFFEAATKIIDKRVDEAEAYYKKILSKPFDVDINETVEVDAEKLDYASSKKELIERWRLNLKYSVIDKLYSLEQDQEKKKERNDSDYVEKSFAELEAEAREKVLKSHDLWFKRLHQLDKDDRLAGYLNTVTSMFDPHTNFYPPKDKDNFDIALSGRLEGIGATLQEKDGYIKVSQIVPGSASWKQGELEAGDVILKVGQGELEAVDIVDMPLDDAVMLIRGPKGTEVRLTVEKIDGTSTVIPIIRDIVILEETYAKSLMLESKEEGEKIGYIKLPKFYADFSGSGGRSCADDVEKEVAKLKAEGAKGLVIDLRNNGGGSLHDVVQMAGLFIEMGPIVQIKGREGAPYIMSDLDPRVQFDGPMVILVNSMSASASEILAAAMQDYGRAVVIGSASTYGKGTVQRFIELDAFLPESMKNLSPLGSMKLTIQKFYRVDGGATQLKGVIPDIVLPDNYMYIEIGEKELDHAMGWSEIPPASYKKTKAISNMPELVLNSSQRVEKDSIFSIIEEKAKYFKESRDETVYNLDYNTFKAEREKEKKENKKYNDLMKPIEDFLITNVSMDTVGFSADTSKVARNAEFLKSVKKDSYIYEAVNVIGDMN